MSVLVFSVTQITVSLHPIAKFCVKTQMLYLTPVAARYNVEVAVQFYLKACFLNFLLRVSELISVKETLFYMQKTPILQSLKEEW
jgi:hypothetical protein